MSAMEENDEDVTADAPIALEDVVDREALDDLCRSMYGLFDIGVRVYSSQGVLLANVAHELDVCRFVNETPGSRAACGQTVSAAKNVDPGESGEVQHTCFTGLAYRIVSLEHEGRRVGRIVLGPYAPDTLKEAAPALAQTDKRLDVVQANERLARVPRIGPVQIVRIGQHLKETLELIIFSSHKAWVTSKMHLYSVRESYRELQEKTVRLEQTLARLKEVDRLKSNFLATMSTPLTSIIGYSEMLAEGIAGPLQGEQEEYVRTIHTKGEQLLRLIMGLLDLSKLESGTMSLRQAPSSISPILKEVMSTLTPVARKKEVELVLDDDAEVCELAADAERLRQVFINLVDNAVKFTPKGGRVSMIARVKDVPAARGDDDDDDDDGMIILVPMMKAVEVRVADTGIGIPASERTKVFDAFYQVDSSSTREYGGTGLGLSIVKRIIDAHGGTVRVEGNDPNGTVFVVTLPSAQTRRAALPSRVPPAPT
ncbi:MAG: PocR ligand-binding domain-containing protein [Labilithrix sp.]|nr:PocR ligand-binding domain-containing protein [Labilithrix sp.]